MDGLLSHLLGFLLYSQDPKPQNPFLEFIKLIDV